MQNIDLAQGVDAPPCNHAQVTSSICYVAAQPRALQSQHYEKPSIPDRICRLVRSTRNRSLQTHRRRLATPRPHAHSQRPLLPSTHPRQSSQRHEEWLDKRKITDNLKAPVTHSRTQRHKSPTRHTVERSCGGFFRGTPENGTPNHSGASGKGASGGVLPESVMSFEGEMWGGGALPISGKSFLAEICGGGLPPPPCTPPVGGVPPSTSRACASMGSRATSASCDDDVSLSCDVSSSSLTWHAMRFTNWRFIAGDSLSTRLGNDWGDSTRRAMTDARRSCSVRFGPSSISIFCSGLPSKRSSINFAASVSPFAAFSRMAVMMRLMSSADTAEYIASFSDATCILCIFPFGFRTLPGINRPCSSRLTNPIASPLGNFSRLTFFFRLDLRFITYREYPHHQKKSHFLMKPH